MRRKVFAFTLGNIKDMGSKVSLGSKFGILVYRFYIIKLDFSIPVPFIYEIRIKIVSTLHICVYKNLGKVLRTVSGT